MSLTLHIRLLGDFQLVYGTESVTGVNTARVQSLLVHLLMHRNAAQSRQHLAFLFWPDSSETQARTNLRQTLHHLRQALPAAEGFLEVGARTLQWRPDAPFILDVAEEELGDNQSEWRGQVQHVPSGETRYFREWSSLQAFLLTKLQGSDNDE